MFKRLNFIKKNMLFSTLSVILVGIILISISYIVEINSLVSQLHEQSKKMTEKWYNEIKVEDVKKAKESSSIETEVQKKLTKYFDEISEYNPNIAQAYIYGAELKNGNQTSIIAFPSHVWKLFKKYNLKLGDMYEQPENVVQALKKIKRNQKGSIY